MALTRSVPAHAAKLSIAIALVVLVGWTLEVEILQSGVPGWPVTKANTAVCLLLAGLALRLRAFRWSWLLAVPVMLVALVSLAETFLGWDSGIDQLLFRDTSAHQTAGPGRMAVNTAAALVFLGAAIVLARGRRSWHVRAAEICAGVVALILILYITGLVARVEGLEGKYAGRTAMAVPTAAALLALSAGVLFARSEGWLAQRVASTGPDGTVTRGLVPIVVFVPLVLAWFRALGQNAGWYDTQVGIAITTAGTVTLVTVAGFWIVGALERESRARLTVEHALAMSEERQRLAMDSARIGTWFWDVPADNLVWTPVCKALFGLDPDQTMSYAVFEAALHPEDRARTRDTVVRSWRERTDFRIEYRAVWPDGSEHWLAAQGRSWFDDQGKATRMMGAIHDIDERKRAQLELERSNADLERFAYVASHDLKEPLRTVSSFTSLLRERYRGRLDADADEFVGFIVNGVDRMQRLIDELLAYSRLRSSEMRVTLVSTRDALGAALHELHHAVTESNAIVTHDALPDVRADATQIEQVFANLIGNAIKFRRAPVPRIHVGARRANGEWVFSVADDGIGIDARHYDRIFGLFRRLHSPAAYPGTGLGLAITKVIVERHRGRIWVESEPDHGATFYFTLPAMNGQSGKALADVA